MNKLLIVFLLFVPTLAFAEPDTIAQVIDGNTIKLSSGAIVQLIGIVCPDIKTEQGEKAYQFARSYFEGKTVRLEFDVEQANAQGRLFAYVFDTQSAGPRPGAFDPIWFTFDHRDIFVNATMVKAGYARAVSLPPNVKYAQLLQELYQQAQDNKVGLWKGKIQNSSR